MQSGVYDNLTNAEYHGGEGISKSGLDLIQRSAAHFAAAREAANDGAPKVSTVAQAIGTAFHALVLEPALFVQEYALPLRSQDVPDAIADRDALVEMVAGLNAGRLAKLPTSGSKTELVDRVLANQETHLAEELRSTADQLAELKAAELKELVESFNAERHGLLSTTGSMQELAALLRANGKPVRLWPDAKDEWLRNNGHRQVLDAEAWDQLHRMRDSVMAHPAARALIEAPGIAELSVYWVDPVTGEKCRCRPDFWRMDGVMVDVKTTDDASPEGFAKSIAKWRYHVQQPFYLDGASLALQQADAEAFGKIRHPDAADDFVFLAVEKNPPYLVGVYMLDAASVQAGREEYRRNLDVFAECNRTGVWPGYGNLVQPISLPAWYLRRTLEAA